MLVLAVLTLKWSSSLCSKDECPPELGGVANPLDPELGDPLVPTWPPELGGVADQHRLAPVLVPASTVEVAAGEGVATAELGDCA